MSLGQYAGASRGAKPELGMVDHTELSRMDAAREASTERAMSAKVIPKATKTPERSPSDPVALAITASTLGRAMPGLAAKLATNPDISAVDAQDIMAASNPDLFAALNETVVM